MSRIASGCLGMKTILVAMSGSFCGLTRRLHSFPTRRSSDLVAENARRVALAGRVLNESRVARAEDVLGPVAQTDLELPGKNDDELAARRGVPVDELAHRPLAERDLIRRKPLQPVGLGLELDLLDVCLLVGARIQPECAHRALPFFLGPPRRGRNRRDASIEADP